MNQPEIPLAGGRSTATVVRIGETVRRSPSANAPFVHEVLKELESHGFRYSPRFIGMDEHGREILTFLAGDVPRGKRFTQDQLLEATMVLRQMHDILSRSDLCRKEETVCHGDFAPWTMILQDESITGVIDFDDSRPGKRVDDVAYFLWTFLDIGSSSLPDEEVLTGVRTLVEHYGESDCKNLSEALLRQQHRIFKMREKLAVTDQTEEKRRFSRQAATRIQQEIEWVRLHADRI